jgi:hypothetical protein
LHLGYSLIFRNVIETRELHEVIATFPESRQVRGVGQDQLTHARIGLLLVSLLELAAVPWLTQATAKVLRDEEEGEVATAGDALRSTPFTLKLRSVRPGPVIVAIVVSVLIGWLVERSGLLLLEFVADPRVFPFFGLMQAVARGVAGPFLLTTLVYAQRPKGSAPRAPTVY